jgi:hypothetical protein
VKVGARTWVEVATAGAARERLAAATFEAVEQGSVNVVEVAHDAECPALAGGGLAACTCEIVTLVLERVA